MHSLIQFDQSLSAHFSTFTGEHAFFKVLMIATGEGLVYLIPLILLYVWFYRSRTIALKAAIAGLFAILVLNKIVAHFVNRTRPSLSHIGAQELVFHRPDASFPSDHAAFLMAIAAVFYLYGEKKLGNLVLILAILSGIGRVALGLHFPGDILGGFLLGILTAYLIQLIDKPLTRYLINPFVNFAKRVGL